ncbi:MAG: carboxy terminal-processing peptidase [Pseudomonadota bacterium]
MTLNQLSRTGRRPFGWLALSALFALAIVGSGSTGAPAKPSVLPPGALAPTDRQEVLARRIGNILESEHYRRAPIDDAMSVEVFRLFLETLDSQRSYFLASDISEFKAWERSFDDMIHDGNMERAFAIFARYQQRTRERIQYALKQLDTEPTWTVEETFEFDRDKAPWPETTKELDELWRKRVKNDALSLTLTGKNWKETSESLRRRYERILNPCGKITADEVFELVMNAYSRAYDPHSNYFGARNSEEYKIQMSLSYEGIGATLQAEDDYASIVNLVPGGPAAVAGTLGIKDRITAIAQGKDAAFEDVIGWCLNDVVQKIRGKGGTVVRFHLLPAGAAPGSSEKTVELTRGKVTLENQAAKKQRMTVTRNGRDLSIGVINVPGFYRDTDAEERREKDFRSTTRDVTRLLEELRKEGPVDGLVLDLRGDGGGFLPEATALTGLFIDKGPVVLLKGADGSIQQLDDPSPGSVYDGPLVVLVDRYSASASEIFAGAIQDYGRGYIVGQRTFGKGTVQNLLPLEDRWTQKATEGQLTVTIGKFYRVTGASTQHRGVEPDIILPSAIDMNEVGESSLEEALPWDTIPSSTFQRFRSPAPLPTPNVLSSSEAERVKTDASFKWLVDSIAADEKLRARKSISLNLAKRKVERDTLDAERLMRENVRRAALGKPAFANLEAMDKAAAEAAAPVKVPEVLQDRPLTPEQAAAAVAADKLPDILLDRTTEIMGDIVVAVGSAAPARSRPLAQSAGGTAL